MVSPLEAARMRGNADCIAVIEEMMGKME